MSRIGELGAKYATEANRKIRKPKSQPSCTRRYQVPHFSNEVGNKDGTAERVFFILLSFLSKLLLVVSKGALNNEKDPHNPTSSKRL
jgi:hypothetical protein